MASGAPEFLGGTAEAKPRGKKRAVASKYDVHKVMSKGSGLSPCTVWTSVTHCEGVGSNPSCWASLQRCAAQVKVWLGDNLDHYYILSRFLVSRSLTITKIPSTKVAL